MKMFLISDNTDTLAGMRLAGVEGVVVHDTEETVKAIKNVAECSDYGIILITHKLKKCADDFLSAYMAKHSRPLFLEIPDRHGNANSNSIGEFIEKSIGVKL